MQKIILATHNLDKARELQQILGGVPIEIVTLDRFPDFGEVEETGTTFEQNALLKARAAFETLHNPSVADDSGLEVDALNGEPGVYSARYAGLNCTYADNNRKLLNALKIVPHNKRTARFVCVAAFVASDDEQYFFRGTLEGAIALESTGENGFGYDPVFVPNGEKRSLAEMTADEKNTISHRGVAFKQLALKLKSLYGI